jgi:MYXO-CTERM domain-containing protein
MRSLPALLFGRRPRNWPHLFFAVASFGALALHAAPAAAFCRSTTCSGSCPRNEDGCKTTGSSLYWASRCVGFSLSVDASSIDVNFDTFKAVSNASVAQWSARMCPQGEATFAFAADHPVTCHKAEYNPKGPNANIILFQDNCWTYKSADNTLAKTTVSYDANTGEILDADIEINHAYNEITTEPGPTVMSIGPSDTSHVVYDLQAILTHEFGHFLGLDHSMDPTATMNAAYDPGTIDLRSIEEDDLGGVCAIYPPKRVAACDKTPRNGFSGECGLPPPCGQKDTGDAKGTCAVSAPGDATGSAGVTWLAALAAALLAARRRSSSPAANR